MKFNFVQKKGVVVALAAALSVASFGITALAGIGFYEYDGTQSVYFQSNQSVALGTNDHDENISLSPNDAEKGLNATAYYRNMQSVNWRIEKKSGDSTISKVVGEGNTVKVKATGNGDAIFELKVGDTVLKTWTVTAQNFGNGGNGGAGGGGGAVATKPEKETETAKATISKEADGSMKLVDADGKAVVNAKVTIDGKNYLSDANGKVITNAIATTPKGNKVYCGADGAIVKNKTVTVAGKKYLASKTGKIVTNKIAKTPKGNLVYCTKSGAIKTNGIFKVDGKKYIAKKSGALYTNRWVTIGNTKYYCNKKGVVTKTKAVSTAKK